MNSDWLLRAKTSSRSAKSDTMLRTRMRFNKFLAKPKQMMAGNMEDP
jgi:hypothetical protein